MPPLSLLVKPASGMCNYQCRYCFYADVMTHRETPKNGLMTASTLEALVRRALAYGEGQVTFGFQGGEPTLAGLSFFRELLKTQKRYAGGARVLNCLQTNGSLLNEEWADFLCENHFLVGLSMDGDACAHNEMRLDASGEGTYARTQNAARLLKARNVEFNVLCVVNSLVAKRPREAYEALREYGYIQFIPCIDDFDLRLPRFSPSPEELGRFLIETFQLYKRDILAGHYVSVRAFDNYIQMLMGHRPESCGMSGRCSCNFAIESTGDVYPCDFYMSDEWKIGSVVTDTFAQMAKHPRAKAFVESSVYVSLECRACRHFALCRGGCRRDREPFDAQARPVLNKYCGGYRAFFDACAKDLRMLAGIAGTK